MPCADQVGDRGGCRERHQQAADAFHQNDLMPVDQCAIGHAEAPQID